MTRNVKKMANLETLMFRYFLLKLKTQFSKTFVIYVLATLYTIRTRHHKPLLFGEFLLLYTSNYYIHTIGLPKHDQHRKMNL